jgi:biopolymer transport protein TolQ
MDWIANLKFDSASYIGLFLQAEWDVKAIMIGLVLASIWTWAIILSLRGRIAAVRKAAERFEGDYRKTDDIDAFYKLHGDEDHPTARVFAAGVTEWRRSTGGRALDKDGTRERLATTMGAAVALEVDRLSDRLNILATVGATAPFVGLLGTVLGYHAQPSPRLRGRTTARRSRWSRRASPRRCSRPRSACSPPSPP